MSSPLHFLTLAVIRPTRRRHLLGKRGMSCLGLGGRESRINCSSCRRDLVVPARPLPLAVPAAPSGREAAVPSGCRALGFETKTTQTARGALLLRQSEQCQSRWVRTRDQTKGKLQGVEAADVLSVKESRGHMVIRVGLGWVGLIKGGVGEWSLRRPQKGS